MDLKEAHDRWHLSLARNATLKRPSFAATMPYPVGFPGSAQSAPLTLPHFCPVGRCKRSPYHYAAECDDVVRLTREWALWLAEGKATFLRAVAEKNDQHMALLVQHERKKKKHDLAVKEVSVVVCDGGRSLGGGIAVDVYMFLEADRWEGYSRRRVHFIGDCFCGHGLDYYNELT